MKRMAIGCALLALLLCACSEEHGPTSEPQSLSRLLSAESSDADFAPIAPRALVFPHDHGAHPQQRIEWWYLTARLADAEGRRFGLQWALFRLALRPEDRATRADFSGAQIYMLHAAISDLDGARFLHSEGLARGAAGLAGLETSPWRAWLGGCRAQSSAEDALFPLELDCKGEGFSYRLRLEQVGPRVLHGEAGYSRKSQAENTASFYYAYPFLKARGEVELAGTRHAVHGQAWYDHEWTSKLLGADQVGWDWFSLRFDSGAALMLFHIRDTQGRVVSSRGSFIHADGRVEAFEEGAVRARVIREWTSPDSGTRYPLGWRLRSQRFDFDLEVNSIRDGQEFDGAVRYWEGAIDAAGLSQGQPIRAEGYLELTGYGEGAE
jgi:predicted secreted hydrolase